MRFLLSIPIIALSFFVADVAANPHGSPHAARRAHEAIARRTPGDVAVHLDKRFSNSRWTFYDVGLGACGIYNVESDFIVALNSAQFGGGYPGPNCFKKIRMTYNGKTTVATITDECPGCPYGGLDLSRGLFRFFAPESVGVIYGEWDFTDGGDSPDPSPDPPKTTTTKKPPPPPPTPTTTTTKDDPPTPTPHTTTTSTTTTSPTYSPTPSPPKPSSSSYPSSSSSSTINYNSGPAGGLAIPTGAPITDNAPHNILVMNEALIAMGGIVVAGGAAE